MLPFFPVYKLRTKYFSGVCIFRVITIEKILLGFYTISVYKPYLDECNMKKNEIIFWTVMALHCALISPVNNNYFRNIFVIKKNLVFCLTFQLRKMISEATNGNISYWLSSVILKFQNNFRFVFLHR